MSRFDNESLEQYLQPVSYVVTGALPSGGVQHREC